MQQDFNSIMQKLDAMADRKQAMDLFGITEDQYKNWKSEQQTEEAKEDSLAPENGYYTLCDCKVVKKGQEQRFGDHTIQTITFEYKPRRSEKTALICADVWEDSLRYNDFPLYGYYDIRLRIGCRTDKNTGKDYPSVTLVYASRLRAVTML